MAWTHFTDWLEPGQHITKAQRDELLDAIEERMIALCDPAWGWIGDPAPEVRSGHYALVDSGLDFAKTHFTARGLAGDPGDSYYLDLHALLDALGIYYAQTYLDVDFWGGVISQARTDLGLTSGQYLNHLVAVRDRGSPTAAYWNICRRAVQLLRYPYARVTTPFSKRRSAVPTPEEMEEGFDPEDLIDRFFAASETSPGDDYWYAYQAVDWEDDPWLRGERVDGVLPVPDHPMFASYAAWLKAEIAAGGSVVPTALNWHLTYNGSAVSHALTGGGYITPAQSWTGLSVTGNVAFTSKLGCYDNEAEFNAGVAGGGTIEVIPAFPVTDGYLGLFLAPTFTHPYEAL